MSGRRLTLVFTAEKADRLFLLLERLEAYRIGDSVQDTILRALAQAAQEAVNGRKKV